MFKIFKMLTLSKIKKSCEINLRIKFAVKWFLIVFFAHYG
jgi:hypothetical protein